MAHALTATSTSVAGQRMAAEERRYGFGNRLGTLHVEEMTDALNRAVLDLREPRAESLGHLNPQRLSVGAEHREDRLGDGGRLLSAKRPGAEGGQFDTEERVGVLDSLRNGARNAFVEYRSTRVPFEAAYRGHERGQRCLMLAGG